MRLHPSLRATAGSAAIHGEPPVAPAYGLLAATLRPPRNDACDKLHLDLTKAAGNDGRWRPGSRGEVRRMKTQYRVVVIGGGVVGASVIYHLTKFGWSDVALIERNVLTAGSSWHAAGGFHALNADPNISALQSYTIDLLKEIGPESGIDTGMHMTGGYSIASAPARWEWLQSAYRTFQTMGIEDVHLVSPEEVKQAVPIVSTEGVLGALYSEREGYVDPSGVVHAYARAARNRGAEVIEHNRVLELKQRADLTWDVVTEKGTIRAEHVVNAAGLWAKQVGRMVGLELPVSPLEHHYLEIGR